MRHEENQSNKYRLFKVVEGEEIFLEESLSLGWASALAHRKYDESRSTEPEIYKVIVKDLTGRTLKTVYKV